MTTQAKRQKHWLTVKEASELLGVSRDLIYDAVARGELPALRLGRTIRVSLATLEKNEPQLADSSKTQNYVEKRK